MLFINTLKDLREEKSDLTCDGNILSGIKKIHKR